MTLNKWLCQNFDKDKRGHVEIKDIVSVCFSKIITEERFLVFIYFSILPTYIGLVYYFIQIPFGSSDIDFNDMLYSLTNTSTTLGIFVKFWLVGLVPYVILYLLYLISKIKVAKCNLK